MAFETRGVVGFDEVELRGVGHLEIAMGEVESLGIESDSPDILRDIITEVIGGVLIIRFDAWRAFMSWGTSKNVKFTLGAKTLKRIVLSGSCSANATKLTADTLALEVNGAGTISGDVVARTLRVSSNGSADFELTGMTESLCVVVNGAGTFGGLGMTAKSADVRLVGGGKATVTVEETLTVNVVGAGTVVFGGHPRVNQNIVGYGRVEAAPEAEPAAPAGDAAAAPSEEAPE